MNKPTLRLTLTNTTPLLVGWYDPYVQDPIGVRATEIKGLWRWWCRAFIAGAMFDQRMLCGDKRKSGDYILLIPGSAEAKAISCLVGKVLGLGYVGEHGAEASRFRLFVEVEGDTNVKMLIKRFKNNLQRIKLLSVRREVEGLDSKLKFTLVVEKVRERYRDGEDLALKILIASLQLSGIGKGGRRGLGSLNITSITPESLDIPGKSFRNLIENIYNSAKAVVMRYRGECNVEVCRSQDDEVSLPPLPAVSTKNTFKICTINTQRDGDFIYVHNFFIRSERCKQLTGRSVCNDNLRNNYSAWFLGLPREQKGTGYKIKSGPVVRRPSPIFLAYHTKGNIYGQGIFVSTFLSGDWPRKLEWIGSKRSEPVEVDFNKLKKAYSTFEDEFNDYLFRRNLSCEILWP